MAIDSLLSPNTVAFFLTQSQLFSSHSVSSAESLFHALVPIHLHLAIVWCQFTGSVLPNTTL